MAGYTCSSGFSDPGGQSAKAGTVLFLLLSDLWLLTTLLTSNEGVSLDQKFCYSWHQLGILQFSSYSYLPRVHQTPQVKDSVPINWLLFQKVRFSSVFWPIAYKSGFPPPPPQIQYATAAHKTQGITLSSFIYQFITKDETQTAKWKRGAYLGSNGVGVDMKEHPWSFSTKHSSQHLKVFTNLNQEPFLDPIT